MSERTQAIQILTIDESGNIDTEKIQIITVLNNCTIQDIIISESIDIDNNIILIGAPRYRDNGFLENTKIEPELFENTISDLNMWHPNDILEITICNINFDHLFNFDHSFNFK